MAVPGALVLGHSITDSRESLHAATVAAYCRERPLSAVEHEALPETMLLGCLMAIDMQLMYFHNLAEVSRLAQDLALMVRDLDELRKAVAAAVAHVRR